MCPLKEKSTILADLFNLLTGWELEWEMNTTTVSIYSRGQFVSKIIRLLCSAA